MTKEEMYQRIESHYRKRADGTIRRLAHYLGSHEDVQGR